MNRCLKVFLGAWAINVSSSVFAAGYSNLWIFGDSFSDNGSTVDIMPLLKSAGAPPLPSNGKLSDGKLWIEYFAESLGMPERAETVWVKGGRNPGNYSMIAASSRLSSILIQDFPDQVDLLERQQQRFGSNDLVVIQMGINDGLSAMKTFGQMLKSGKTRDEAMKAADQDLAKAIVSYKAQFHRLISFGARKFMVMNAPDLGLAPFARQRNAVDLARLYSMRLNGMIAVALNEVKASHKAASGLSIKTFDLLANLHKLMADPSAYGLSTSLIRDSACGERGANNRVCTQPEKYFYYDLNHPTSQVNQVISKEALRVLE
ncbi:MAG: SGNH/GDSL hydrolase family protein [Pseudomonadota bacterium]